MTGPGEHLSCFGRDGGCETGDLPAADRAGQPSNRKSSGLSKPVLWLLATGVALWAIGSIMSGVAAVVELVR